MRNLFGDDGSAYERHRQRMAESQRAKSQTGRDIGAIPEVANPVRRAAAEGSLRLFYEQYFPTVFHLEWSEDHLRVIEKIQHVIVMGALLAIAMPRGSGKSTLIALAALWAVLTGRRRFPVCIGPEGTRAREELMGTIKTELETNEALAADFPEVCYPIRCLDGINQRASGQLYRGRRTHIRWKDAKIVLPTIEGSKASGAIIVAGGITAALRGMKHVTPGGEHVRPDLILLDDPQTDESARSPSQCDTRERLIDNAIVGMSGPGQRIAGLAAVTIIDVDDLAERLVNREKKPQWSGERTKMLYDEPRNTELWDEYARIYLGCLEVGDTYERATEFYREHRAEMDAGARVAWPARHAPDELSGLQHAMNIKIATPLMFASEYQNEPVPRDPGDEAIMTQDEIAAKLSKVDRRVVPEWATKLVAFVDVQKEMLFWMVAAFDDRFRGTVIDYGTFPEQGVLTFTYRSARKTLSRLYPKVGWEEAVRMALLEVERTLLLREHRRADGSRMSIDAGLVDAGWGESTDTVFEAVQAMTGPFHPSFGFVKDVTGIPMNEWRAKPGETVGHYWRMRRAPNRAIRHVLYDPNYWKSFLHARLRVPGTATGSLTLYGDTPFVHKTLAQHLTSEYRTRVTAKSHTIDVWKLRSKSLDNHWLDCAVGCMVAAAFVGVTLPGTGIETRPARKKALRPSEIRRRKAGMR